MPVARLHDQTILNVTIHKIKKPGDSIHTGHTGIFIKNWMARNIAKMRQGAENRKHLARNHVFVLVRIFLTRFWEITFSDKFILHPKRWIVRQNDYPGGTLLLFKHLNHHEQSECEHQCSIYQI